MNLPNPDNKHNNNDGIETSDSDADTNLEEWDDSIPLNHSSGFRDVVLHITPLNSPSSSRESGSGPSISLPFHSMKHWAIQAGDTVYEVDKIKMIPNRLQLTTLLFIPTKTSFYYIKNTKFIIWKAAHPTISESIPVGRTLLSDSRLSYVGMSTSRSTKRLLC